MAFWDNIRFPYFNMQELNLDWIMRELKRIAGFMPQDGNVGDILTRKSDGAAWEPPEAVNININALPEDTEIGENDQLIFYDISAQANRKIKPPNMLDSMMSNGTPLMDGTASPGTSKKPARYDHKHPTDTSRQAALSGVQMAAVNSGAHADSFDSNGILKFANGGLNDSGVSASGVNYCKMPDGTLIQWGRLTVSNVAIQNVWGSLFESGQQMTDVTFPIAFVGSPACSATANISPSAWIEGLNSSTTGLTSYFLVRPTSVASATGHVDWIAVGRWKA